MIRFQTLDTGITVFSYKGKDGVLCVKVLDKNETYKFNVWWTKTKNSLSSKQISTKS
jgi:hypothetical protein